MNNKNIKINLVNPLNPNQIIKEEIIEVKQQVAQQNIEKEEIQPIEQPQPIEKPEPIEEKKQTKKLGLWILVIISIVILLLGAGYFIFIKDKPNNTTIQNTNITLNDISNNFNKNIQRYNTIENSSITSNVLNNRINIKININENTTNYDFILNNQTLNTSLSDNDAIGYEILIYISCAIANYYNIDFDSSYTYLKNNSNDLNSINNITITNQNQTKKISINLNEKLIIK